MTSSLLMYNYLSNLTYSKNILRTQCFILNEELQITTTQMANQLFKLNPLAETLRLRKKYIQIQIVAALASGQAYIVAGLNVQLAMVIEQQKKLDQIQTGIIQVAQTRIKAKLIEKNFKLQKYYNQLQETWGNLGILKNTIYISKWPAFPIQADIPFDLAPKYDYSYQFEHERKLTLTLHNLMSKWTIKQKNQNSIFTCEASYKLAGKKFIPQIKMAKSFLN